MQAKLVAVSQVNPNKLNPNELTPEQYQKLKNHLKDGNYPSLIVFKSGNGYSLIDGWHRLQIGKELGWDKMWCEVWDVDEKKGNLLLATLNRLRGTDDTQKRIKLISKLYSDYDYDKNLLSSLLPESERSLESILKVVEEGIGDIDKEIEDERGILESKLSQVVDPDEAKRMASLYKHDDDGKLRLTFIFDDEKDFFTAVKFFGQKSPSVKKLIKLLEDGSQQR